MSFTHVCTVRPAGFTLPKSTSASPCLPLLAAVGDVNDGRHVLLAPVDGVGETADEHQYGIGIGLEHQLHQVFIGQHQRFAVHGFAASLGTGENFQSARVP